jgi:hypothetical protein
VPLEPGQGNVCNHLRVIEMHQNPLKIKQAHDSTQEQSRVFFMCLVER